MVGYGWRGARLGGIFGSAVNARVVAVAELRADRRHSSARMYPGPEGFRELAASRLDAVAIASPARLRALHARAALDAGKHVFVSAPAAVNIAACLDLRGAPSGSSFVIDLPQGAKYWMRLWRGNSGTQARLISASQMMQ